MLPFAVLDMVLHLDLYLNSLIVEYGLLVYVILFVVILLETGLVVTPFLPGDSLLFVAGTFAALGSLDMTALFILLASAAILGDTANYWIGHRTGKRAYGGGIRFLNKERLKTAEGFFRRHGGKTIIIARFIPLVRTFAPFVAGIGVMEYRRFITYNIVGGVAWVGLFLSAGYLFGNIPFIRDNLSLFLIALIAVSLAAAFAGFRKSGKKKL